MNKKINILAISPTFYPVMGGAERTIYELYKSLPNYGYHIDLVVPNLGGKKYEKICEGFEVYRVGKKLKHRVSKFILYQIWEYLKIRELIKTKKYDLIHIHYGFPSFFVLFFISKKLKKPLILTEHHFGTGMDITDSKENPFLVNFLLRKGYKKVNKIITLSKEQKTFVNSICGRKDIEIIPFGVNLNKFNPSKYDEKLKKKYKAKKIVITVSRLNKRKKIDDLILASRFVVEKFPATKFLIIGEGEEKENLEKLIKKLNLENKVYLVGFVSDKDIPRYYATADIFVLTSKYEGFGLVYPEAMASGTPIITYNIRAAREIINDGINGYLVNNINALSSKIIELIKNQKLLKKIRQNARKIAEEKYNIENIVSQYNILFKGLIKNEK